VLWLFVFAHPFYFRGNGKHIARLERFHDYYAALRWLFRYRARLPLTSNAVDTPLQYLTLYYAAELMRSHGLYYSPLFIYRSYYYATCFSKYFAPEVILSMVLLRNLSHHIM